MFCIFVKKISINKGRTVSVLAVFSMSSYEDRFVWSEDQRNVPINISANHTRPAIFKRKKSFKCITFSVLHTYNSTNHLIHHGSIIIVHTEEGRSLDSGDSAYEWCANAGVGGGWKYAFFWCMYYMNEHHCVLRSAFDFPKKQWGHNKNILTGNMSALVTPQWVS